MEIKVEVLNFRVTDKRGYVIPKSIAIEDIKVRVYFGEETAIEIDELNGEYSPEFTSLPFLLDPESVVKLVDAAYYRGVDLLKGGEFWRLADGAIAEALGQTKVKIA